MVVHQLDCQRCQSVGHDQNLQIYERHTCNSIYQSRADTKKKRYLQVLGERWCLKCFTTLYLWHCLLLSGVVWPCLADGNKLRQLFTNLLSSSLQFSSSRSKSIQAECHKIASKRRVCASFNCSRKSLLCPYLDE